MLHVYRQVCGIKGFDHTVVTRNRLNPEVFPFENLEILRKWRYRFFHRLYHQMIGNRVPINNYEVKQMLALSRQHNADVVHAYFGTEAARILPYLRQETCAKVVSFHGADLSAEFTQQEHEELLEVADLFLCRSEALRDALIERGTPPERICLNRTGVPMADHIYRHEAPEVDEDRPLRILQACRFIEKKGLDTTLQAVAQLAKEDKLHVDLTLAGDGPQMHDLEELVEELDLNDVVRFTGFLSQEDLIEEFQTHDVFVHPSRETDTGDREGIPNVILEAMANGLPVISTEHSGIPEAIENGKEGILIPYSESHRLAKAIKDLIEDEDLYMEIGTQARQRVADDFSIEACIEQLESHYREAMEIAQERRAKKSQEGSAS